MSLKPHIFYFPVHSIVWFTIADLSDFVKQNRVWIDRGNFNDNRVEPDRFKYLSLVHHFYVFPGENPSTPSQPSWQLHRIWVIIKLSYFMNYFSNNSAIWQRGNNPVLSGIIMRVIKISIIQNLSIPVRFSPEYRINPFIFTVAE